MLQDYHLHTHFSGDSDSSVESMIESAIQKGLKEICITDHIDYDYPNDPLYFYFSPEEYFHTLPPLLHSYESDITVRIGVELGLQPHVSAQNKALTDSHPWDFIIASCHVVDGQDPYYVNYWEANGIKGGIRRYFDVLFETLETFQEFDVYGHLDYIIRYCPEPYIGNVYKEFQEPIEECLKKILSLGKGIELNTGGLRYGLGHPNPHEDILKRYHELGGKILTLGSDAHKPEDLAFGFDQAINILQNCGFSHLTAFNKRKPVFMPL